MFNSVMRDDLIWSRSGFPKKVSQDEDIIMLVREDIAVLVFKAIGLYFMFVLFLVARVFVVGSESFLLISAYDALVYFMAALLLLIFTISFHNYYLSMQMITTERIIDIDQKGLFKREVNSTPVSNIQDVTFTKNGFLKSLFNFGDVIVQTSGEQGSVKTSGFVFENVPEPAKVSHVINQVIEESRGRIAHDQAKIEAEYIKKALDRR